MTDVWQPGKTYIPGSIVRPTAVIAPGLTALLNPGFESGDLTGWTVGTGTWAVGGSPYSGSFKVRVTGNGTWTLKNNATSACFPGQTINANGFARLTNAGTDDQGAEIALYWYDASSTFISQTEGVALTGVGGSYRSITVSGVAPANAASVQLVLGAHVTSGGNIDFDAFTWSSSYSGPPSGLVYKATQAAPGKSGAIEPVWPGNTTTPVTDNQVTWQGVIASQIVWEAIPINQSGATEPVWPTTPGGMIHDGTIDWQGQTKAIHDVNCPHSAVVAIAASKIYAADNDIIRYSATVNPLDWTATNDAGYLPYGLNNYGSNPAAAMGLYRSNLCIFNSEGFQMWQVDEDPANTALLDALPIASTWNTALSPVANDLLFLSSKGVRSVGVAATGVSLESGDVGMPIDALVQPELKLAVTSSVDPIACYVPSEGQYWLAFATQPIPPVPSTRWSSALGLQWTNTGNNVTLPFSGTVSGSLLPSVVVSQAQLATLLGAGDSIIGVRASGTLTVSAFTAGSLTSFHWATNIQSQNTVVGANPITLAATSWDGQGNFSLGASLIAGGTSITFAMSQLDIKIQNSGGGTPGVPGSTVVFVYTLNRLNAPGTWSRYVFPYAIDDFCTLNDILYIRSGDDVLFYDEDALSDYNNDPRSVTFDGVIWWPWLDFNSASVTKRMDGFDVVGVGVPSIQIAYDQSNVSAATIPYTVPADSIPGMMIPMPVMAPSFSVKVTYPGGQKWKLQAINLWFTGMRPES